MIVCNDLSNSYFTLDVRVRVVACKLEILIPEVEYVLHVWIQYHLRKRAWLTCRLQLDLLQMVVLDVSVSQRVNKLTRL